MRLQQFQSLTSATGPFATAVIDASRTDPTHAQEIGLRWAAQRRSLERSGAPSPVVEAMEELILEPTGTGRVGRLVVATETDGVLLDLTLPEPPLTEESMWGPVPHLMPAVRATAGKPSSYVVAQLDRTGADVDVVTAFGSEHFQEQVQGDHDELHKIRGGGWAHLRYQHRVEDSWDHNVGEAVTRLERLVDRHRVELVLVGGDTKALAVLERQLPTRLRDRTVTLETGGRAAGSDSPAAEAEVAERLDAFLRSQRADRVERFSEQLGRGQAAVEGLDSVVDCLRRAQVEEVLLHDVPSSTAKLWVGDAVGQYGSTADEVRAMGCDEPQQARADAVLLWALIATDARITLLDDGERELREGIGALLRYADASTRHDTVPSMPGHGEAGAGEIPH
ncbi:MAG TPA: Vms1/Ankzf1 family peptidyl-tRNA hydrolase [Actinomycetales bacterium]|jgi:hypothetical protein